MAILYQFIQFSSHRSQALLNRWKEVSMVTDKSAEIKKKYKKSQKNPNFFSGLWHFEKYTTLNTSDTLSIFKKISSHIFHPNPEPFWLYVCWILDTITPILSICQILNFGKAFTGHKACKIEWIGTVLKYLLRDGLEIGMSTGTCSNPQCFSPQYLINLILLLVRGESVAN